MIIFRPRIDIHKEVTNVKGTIEEPGFFFHSIFTSIAINSSTGIFKFITYPYFCPSQAVENSDYYENTMRLPIDQ